MKTLFLDTPENMATIGKMYMTGGRRGYWADRISSSYDRVINYWRNTGESEANILRYLTRTGTPTGVPTDMETDEDRFEYEASYRTEEEAKAAEAAKAAAAEEAKATKDLMEAAFGTEDVGGEQILPLGLTWDEIDLGIQRGSENINPVLFYQDAIKRREEDAAKQKMDIF